MEEFYLTSLAAYEALQQLMSSSSSEDSEGSSIEDFDVDNSIQIVCASQTQEEHPKQTNYLDVIEKYSNRDFWRHFRIGRDTL